MTSTFRSKLTGFAAVIFFYTPVLFCKNDNSYNAKNTVVTFDLDKVLIHKSTGYKLRFIFHGLNKNIFKYFNGLYSMKNAQASKGGESVFLDQDGNQIHGVTFQFLHTAMLNPSLREYAADLVKFTEETRCIDKNMMQLIKQIKAQGYTIAFATNKDRVSYDYVAKKFGKEFTDLADIVFVAQPGNNEQFTNKLRSFIEDNKKTLPRDYVRLAQKALTVQPTDIIRHAPTQKPNDSYYKYVLDTIGQNKHVIFIDDRKQNIEGFNKQHFNANKYDRIGIHFKNVKQLTLDLYIYGILNNVAPQVLYS